MKHISRSNCTEINWDRQAAYEIFSTNVDCDGPSLDFLGSRKPAHEGIKERNSGTPAKVVTLPLLASLSWKRLQIGMGMLPIAASTSDEFFSRINIDDFERRWTSKTRSFFIDFCDLRLQRTLQEWTATKWQEIDWQFANRNCYGLSRVSWASAQISCTLYAHTTWAKLYSLRSRSTAEITNNETKNIPPFDCTLCLKKSMWLHFLQ